MNNYFFDDQSIIRSSYQKKDDTYNNQAFLNNIEPTTLSNSHSTFDNYNKKVNDLQDEISELRDKLKEVHIKDDKIQQLENKIKDLENEINKYIDSEKRIKVLSKAVITIKEENKILRNQLDNLKIFNLEMEEIKKENILLKQKLKEKLIEDPNKKDKIKINSDDLKKILYNRLKNHHEKHIDELLESYKLSKDSLIDKEDIEKLLLKAIHM